ncbi:3-oxoacyl-[acyl-carrier-protein] synthase III C-terminal domain-containing protein [Kitasatospora sp. NPDC049285]|uniref:3-oxoacyl-[acyl-carrier-protein] synthase III C-terminal domain-containing protein n=1 Tax=Kitasatospora sp. NPDC049285 TaxID=3157096 RepID=UPI00343026A5
MRSVHLSGIGHVHGEPHQLSELRAELGDALAPMAEDIASYRASTAEIWELAAEAAAQSLAGYDADPDALLYVSQNEPDSAGALALLADRLGLRSCASLALSGQDCGNFGPALQLARDLVRSGSRERVLLVLADRARSPRDRLMGSGMSIFSDGAAACLVTTEQARAAGPGFAVEHIAGRTEVRLAEPAVPGEALLTTVRLARDTTAEILAATGRPREDVRHVLFANYRLASQKFLCTAMGFPHEQITTGAVAELAHCFSADVPVTLTQRRADGTLAPGDLLLASASGPYSWSTVALTVEEDRG